jgi:release factor glutamine methyltransferase
MFLKIKENLASIGIENPTLEARWIIEEYPTIDPPKIEEIISRRALGEPLSRIFGWREFYGRRFDVNEFTLDPRPDSETLIDAVLKYDGAKNNILDLGTGTGCLLITLLCEINDSIGTAVDISSDALRMAQKNAIRHNVHDRMKCTESNWFDSVSGRFDVIISNPPYIRSEVIPDLEESVRNFDPILALDGGLSGIEPYKILLEGAKKHLAEGGRLFFEIGFDQTNELMRLIENAGATLIHIHRDLSGHDRVLEIAYGDK